MTKKLSKILIVDDEVMNINFLGEALADVYSVTVALNGNDALSIAKEIQPELILLDVVMPNMDGYETCRQLKQHESTREIPVIFISALEEPIDRITAFKSGGVDYIAKPLNTEEILVRIETHLTLLRQTQELQKKNEELLQINVELVAEKRQHLEAKASLKMADKQLSAVTEKEREKWKVEAFIGQSDKTIEMLNEIRSLQKAARTNVMILGESGTGKELVSRAIHYGSKRALKPFVAVNCSAIPHDLADAMFFGSLKGSYTGAVTDRTGFFEEAHGGTLFLDEIGNMPIALQIKLLRVLEDGKIMPIGSNTEREVNVRVVSATNVDLQEAIAGNQFRQDLYYRLCGYAINLPPLRERIGDVRFLVHHFLHTLTEEMGYQNSGISQGAMALLESYSFPGNIRELKNLMEFALIRSGGTAIQQEHIHIISADTTEPSAANTQLSPPPLTSTLPSSEKRSRESDEEEIIRYLHEKGQINNSECQDLLNISHYRSTYLLTKLHQDGVIEKFGDRRWTVYKLHSQIK